MNFIIKITYQQKIYLNAYQNCRSLFSANNNWCKVMEFKIRNQRTMKHYVGKATRDILRLKHRYM